MNDKFISFSLKLDNNKDIIMCDIIVHNPWKSDYNMPYIIGRYGYYVVNYVSDNNDTVYSLKIDAQP